MQNPEISLILTCHNEVSLIREAVAKLEEIFFHTNYIFEIIISDDGSINGSRKLIEEMVRTNPRLSLVAHASNLGHGEAVKNGIRQAHGRICGFIDIDFEISPYYIFPLIDYINNGYDIAAIQRISFQPTISFYHIIRNACSRIYQCIRKWYLNIPLNDTEAGCKFFNTKKILPLLEKTKNSHWFWNTEIMCHAYNWHYRIMLHPGIMTRRSDKKSQVKLFPVILDYLRHLVLLKKQLRTKGHDKTNPSL
jgi:glycosyltransferase involved in cell wall biosynthesis